MENEKRYMENGKCSAPATCSCHLLLPPGSPGDFARFTFGDIPLAGIFEPKIAMVSWRHAICQLRKSEIYDFTSEEAHELISIERILCPVPLPAELDGALRYATTLAGAYEADLLLCHCAGTPAVFTSADTATDRGRHAEVKKTVADAMARLIGSFGPAKLRFEVVVADGGEDVGEKIVRAARERQADLIVMRARRSHVAALLGSTAEQVSRTASCPILVVHEEENTKPSPNGQARFSRILVSHDFSGSSEVALSYALSIAQKFRADLHLLHVLPESEQDEPEIAPNEFNIERAYQRAVRRLQSAVPEEIYKRLSVTNVVRWGKPYREILAYAREQDVDLVCMGALGRDFGQQALFGSNVDRVLRQVSCPTLVARPLQTALPALFGSLVARPKLKLGS
jgi:nucleotide-binding universal stress UspA family protein